MPKTPPPAGDFSIEGDLAVADDARLSGNLRCQGRLRIGRRALIEGDVVTGAPVAVRERARISGTLRCAEALDWHPTAAAGGVHTGGPFRVDGAPFAQRLDAAAGVAPAFEEEGV